MAFSVRDFGTVFFAFPKTTLLPKSDYNKVEAILHVSLKQRCCILGHCEQIYTYEYRLMRLSYCEEGKEDLKNNHQVYTTQEGIREIKITLRYTLPKRVKKRVKITLRYTLPPRV